MQRLKMQNQQMQKNLNSMQQATDLPPPYESDSDDELREELQRQKHEVILLWCVYFAYVQR